MRKKEISGSVETGSGRLLGGRENRSDFRDIRISTDECRHRIESIVSESSSIRFGQGDRETHSLSTISGNTFFRGVVLCRLIDGLKNAEFLAFAPKDGAVFLEDGLGHGIGGAMDGHLYGFDVIHRGERLFLAGDKGHRSDCSDAKDLNGLFHGALH